MKYYRTEKQRSAKKQLPEPMMNEEGEIFQPIDECDKESEGPQDAADLEVGFVELDPMGAAYLQSASPTKKLKDMLGTEKERRELREMMAEANGQQLKLNAFAIQK